MERSAISLNESDLERLVHDVEIRVAVMPLSGISPATDWWSASLEELWLEHTDVGIDGALIGLSSKLSDQVSGLLAQPGEERERLLPLLLKLTLADRRGELARVLHDATVAVDYEYDQDLLEEQRRVATR